MDESRAICIQHIRSLWAEIRSVFGVLLIVRFSILIPAVLILALLFADQMEDVLAALGEDSDWVRICWLVCTTIFAALVVWYTARTMLRFQFRGAEISLAKSHPKLKRFLPRGLAITVPAALTLKVAWMAAAGGSDRASGLIWLGVVLAGTTAVVAAYISWRRDAARVLGLRFLAEAETAEQRDLRSVGQLRPTTLGVLIALIGAGLVFLGVFVVTPVTAIGSAAVLLLALGLIATYGSAVVYVANHWAVPILSILLAWLVVSSPFNDNHAVRQTGSGHSHEFLSRASTQPTQMDALPGLARDTVDSYFEAWWTDLAHQDGRDKVPVFVISADGGGIRAAYWTAAVLATLEQDSAGTRSPFSRHVFAMSGVSGGSLGIATFAAAVARRAASPGGATSESIVDEVDGVLGEDLLTPTLESMLFPDLVQRFAPLPVVDDRAIALERAVESAWARHHQPERNWLAGSYWNLYQTPPGVVPLLFLNATVVETGQRAILHPLAPFRDGSQELNADVLALRDFLGAQVPLSTAALLSARFTYVSPAGLIDTHRIADGAQGPRWVRIVDGGYFDNSGAATAAEIVHAIRHAHQRIRDAGQRTPDIDVHIIHIANDPPNARAPLINWSSALNGRVWLGESLSPLRALLATREGRGKEAVAALSAIEHVEVEPVQLYRIRANLPLGWMLSKAVRKEIDRQLRECSTTPADNCAFSHVRRIGEILRSGAEP